VCTAHLGFSLVRDGTIVFVNLNEVFLSYFGCFGDGSRYVGTLSETDAYLIATVTDHDKRAETEPAATFYNSGDTVNMYDPLVKALFFLLYGLATIVATPIVLILGHD
jgi:hypothetical protein